MAAVPSIVYGLWGFFLIMPHAAELALWLHRNLGWIPFFDVRGSRPGRRGLGHDPLRRRARSAPASRSR